MTKRLKLNNCELKLVNDISIPTTARDKFFLEVELDKEYDELEIFFQYGESPIVRCELDEFNQVEVPAEVIGFPNFKTWIKARKGIEITQTNVVNIPCQISGRFISIA